MALIKWLRINLSYKTYSAPDSGSLSLSARHASKPWCNEYLPCECRIIGILNFGCLSHSDCGPMNNALRANVHPWASSHLPIHSHSQGIKVVESLSVLEIWYNLAIWNHCRRALGCQLREEAHRMTWVHVQALVLVHLLQEFHRYVELSPVWEYSSVWSISN
jgi:hypothetical protein